MGTKTICTVIVLFTLLLWVLPMAAQTANISCPRIRLRSPGHLVQPEDSATVAVEVTGGSIEHNSLSFDWYVSRGRITGGRDKPIVEISVEERDEGTTIKVAAFVHGLPKECSASAFSEFQVAPMPIGEPADEFGQVTSRNDPYFLEARLDAYIALVEDSPGYEGLITIEFDKKDHLKNKLRYLQRIYRHFAFRKLDLKRITFAIAEHEYPEKTTLWTMNPKAKMPKYARNYRIIKTENYRNRLNCLFPLD